MHVVYIRGLLTIDVCMLESYRERKKKSTNEISAIIHSDLSMQKSLILNKRAVIFQVLPHWLFEQT